MNPYPRFIRKEVEDIFIHWLNFSRHHPDVQNLQGTVEECKDCTHFKNIVDYGVMLHLHAIVESWYIFVKGSNCSSLIAEYISVEQAENICKNISYLDPSVYDYDQIAKKRVEYFFTQYFPTVKRQEEFEDVFINFAHYLPFIEECDVMFKTLAVRYNFILNNEKNNFYYTLVFVMLCFHLNGLLAFPPAIVKYMWAENLSKILIAYCYLKNNELSF